MAFTREDLVHYEKTEPTPTEPAAPANPQLEEVVQEASAESSTAGESVQAEPVNDGSSKGATAESPTAPAETDSEVQTEAASGDGKPAHGSARERIEDLVTERNALRKYGEYLLDEVKSLRSGKQAQSFVEATKEEPKTEVTADKAPTIEEHNFDPVAYSKAMAEWTDRQIDKRVNAAVQGLETKQTQAQVMATFENRAAEFRKATPDFDLVISNPSLPNLNPNTASLIIRSDLGPQIAYHLAKNPDLAARVARMDAQSQAMAIGRLEATLTKPVETPAAKPPVQKTRTVTQAPPPPKPIPTGAALVEREPLTMDEFVANERKRKLAEKEERRRLRGLMR